MKKLFLYISFLFLSPSVCMAQDTLVCRNGKKIVGKVISVGKTKVTYILPPDSTEKEIPTWRMDYIAYPGGTKFNFTERKKTSLPSTADFYLSLDGGGSVPSISYRDGIVGTHFSVKGTYYFDHHFGLTIKAGVDLNGTGLDYISDNYWGGFYIFQQYLAGISYRLGGKPGFPFIDFVGLCGISNATNPVSEQGGGDYPITVYSPGSGRGIAYYAGIDFTNSSDHFCSITFGAGVLGAEFSYPNYTSTTSTYDPNTGKNSAIVSDPKTTMNLALFQMYVGINFRIKKAGR